MKKLLVLVAFLGLGYAGVQAQTVAPAKQEATKAPQSTSVRNDVNVGPQEDALPAADQKKDKQHCSSAEKKSCGSSSSSSGKKSCCSHKKEAAATPPPAPNNNK